MGGELRAFFEEYADAFSRHDAESIVGRCRVPCLMVNDAGVVPLLTEEALRANMNGLMAHHRANGFGRASVVGLRFDPLGEHLALAHVDWKLEVSDAEDLEFRNTYNLVRDHSGWKVLVSTTHPESAA